MSRIEKSDMLINAILRNNVSEAKRIVEEDPDVLLTSRTSFNILHMVAQNVDIEIVEFLLSQTTATLLEQANGLGETPLHMAAQADYPEVIKAFIEAGADINQRTKYKGDSAQLTPLNLAARKFERIYEWDVPRQHEVVKVLIDAGANIDANSAILINDNEKLEELIAEDPDLERLALDRDLLFANAAAVGNIQAIEILLKHGFRPDGTGLIAALQITERKNDDPSAMEGIKLLLDAGGGEHFHAEVKNHEMTPYEYGRDIAKHAKGKVLMKLVKKHAPKTSYQEKISKKLDFVYNRFVQQRPSAGDQQLENESETSKKFLELTTKNNVVGYRRIKNPGSAQISEALRLDKSARSGRITVNTKVGEYAELVFDRNNFLLCVSFPGMGYALIDTRRKDFAGYLVSMAGGASPRRIVIDDFNVVKKMMLNYLNTGDIVDDPPFIWIPLCFGFGSDD